MWWFPTLWERFFVNLEGVLYRACRSPITSGEASGCDSSKFMKIHLLDTGENHLIPLSDIPLDAFYEMPPEVMEVPPLAIKCIVNNIEIESGDGPGSDGFEQFIADNVYKTFAFEVVSIEDDKLVVNVLPYASSETSSIDIDEEFNDGLSGENVNLVMAAPVAQPIHPTALTKEYFTQQELEILDEEPLNTGNALVAVQGFQTHDDRNICQFYDPELRGCWKGGRCKQLHISKIEDGTCRDRQRIHMTDIPKSFPLPQLFSIIPIEITSFIRGVRFYCRYPTLKTRRDGITLEHLLDEMNSEDEVSQYQRFKFMPGFKELVIVQSNDGRFYRARVEELLDEDCSAELLLVDFGILEKASLKMLYHWVPRFNYLEFQTVEMEIANIQLPRGGHYEDIQVKILKIMDKSPNNMLQAIIVENVVAIRCKLLDEYGDDIGEMLAGEGFARLRSVDPPFIKETRIPV